MSSTVCLKSIANVDPCLSGAKLDASAEFELYLPARGTSTHQPHGEAAPLLVVSMVHTRRPKHGTDVVINYFFIKLQGPFS